MINFAIVGAGFIAQKHIDAINNAEGTNLVAVCDTNEQRLEEYKELCNVYTDLNEMLEQQTDIDVVNICVPSGLHFKLAEIIAAKGKHIVMEKPMALTSSDSEKIIAIAEKANIKLSVVHPNRFRPAIRALQDIKSKGLFGKLSHANATVRWNRGQEYYDQAAWRGTKEFDGGVLMNQAIHNLDLLIWFMGPVKSVQAMAATRLRDIETEDVAVGVVEFESGALGVIEAATTIYPKNLEESLSIFGEAGTVKVGGPNAIYFETLNVSDINEEEKNKLIENIKEDPFGKPGHQWIIEDMVRAVETNTEPVVTGKDGLAPVKLIEAFLESAETGKKVFLQ
ncbi:Gfo/Idh/MocA family protein [Metabacillus litoralis]|uniref:Gfo/Idh/MocA family protein n=1 Tax=Metabacillus litoralis TaxID=152268 RepID=UPI0020414EA3|nr:Gfo/Idh/MocA family oxidoreductase [Metabacillus litoralis]MCM3410113.1 Gfo/Idh/MocA family oxidoreductase [Metabacillus litoralis]